MHLGKPKAKVAVAILMAGLLWGWLAGVVLAAEEEDWNVSAKAYVIMDAKTGQTLLA